MSVEAERNRLMRERNMSRREAENAVREVTRDKYEGLEGMFYRESRRGGGRGESKRVTMVIR